MDYWRGIVSIEVMSKVVSHLLNDRLQDTGEQLWCEEQCGFRKNRGTMDCIIVFRRLIEEFGGTFPPEENQGDAPYILFVDLKKSFDSCNWALFFEMLHRCGVPAKAIAMIKAFHDGFGGELGSNVNSETDWQCHLRQGLCAASLLWNFYFWFVMRLWKNCCETELGADNRGVIIKYKPDLAIRPRSKSKALKSATETRITNE